MKKFIADIYAKNIFEIDYKAVKKLKIKALAFDLDNTLAKVEELKMSKKTKDFLEELSKDFDIFIISNNNKKRVSNYLKDTNYSFVSFSLKPFKRALKIINKNNKYAKEEILVIGDQIVTDVLMAKRFGSKIALVDPLDKKDLKITTLNRLIEKIILKKLAKQDLFVKGRYYG